MRLAGATCTGPLLCYYRQAVGPRGNGFAVVSDLLVSDLLVSDLLVSDLLVSDLLVSDLLVSDLLVSDLLVSLRVEPQ